MKSAKELVYDVLRSMRTDALDCPKDDDSIRSLYKKYDTIFFGKDLNKITSIELLHYINSTYGIEMDNDYLNELLSSLCRNLNMNLIEMRSVNDCNSIVYQVVLWNPS